MLLADVVAASTAVSATRSRKAKTAALMQVLRALAPDEVAPVTAWLSGELLQGRIGTGWRTLTKARTAPATIAGLTVTAVNAALTELASISGVGSVRRRQSTLEALMSGATETEQDFLLRLLLGDLRQGALEGSMVAAVAAAAEQPLDLVRRAFMLSGSLPVTAAAALRGGAAELSAFRLRVGRGVRPMLASPAVTLDAALGELGTQVSVEYKLDGARIQLHRNENGVRVFTRTLRDITASVPELVELVRGLDCTSVVLDGESLAISDTGRPRPFSETLSRFSAQSGESVLRPYFFDCLLLDGVDLLDAPLERRQAALEQVAAPYRIPTLIAPTPDVAAAHYDAALAAGHEGVMIKALAGPYAAGRRGRAWQKIKPEHTLDLVVLGAEWGYGRRTGYLSNLHLGARDPDGGPPIMVGKTFKGLTDELLRWQTAEFPAYERERDEQTVYLHPELVVEIELDGAQTSPRYPGGVALRFARVRRYRPDKTPADADTIGAVRELLPG